MDTEIPELLAMGEIVKVFAALEEEEIQRVLRWANEKYRAKTVTLPFGPSSNATIGSSGRPVALPFPAPSTPMTGSLDGDELTTSRGFSDLPTLIDAAKPTNGLERILVAAYFHQVVKGESDFDSQSLNNQLKHLGYPSANITRDMVRLVDRSPKLVIQTRKEGSSQQARKKFRLTSEGIRAVETLLRKGQMVTE